MQKFRLADSFINAYKKKKPPFGFNGLGELVYMRTYSRIKEDGTNEEWFETLERVVNGTYNMQKDWIESHGLGWNAWKAQKSAQEMYDRMFNMKFLPPGRGLWAMGSPLTEEKKLFATLNNCAFISTELIDQNFSEPFCFLMDMSMLGVGVGFDTKGTEKIVIKGVNKNRKTEQYSIPDTREGWVESVKMLLEAYIYGLSDIQFDYILIRKEGEPIKGFGGISS
jgi:ribonucleoside-triphosphate reductase (thioredoxin)